MRKLGATLVVLMLAGAFIQGCSSSNVQRYPWTVVTMARDTLVECVVDSIQGPYIHLSRRNLSREVLSADSVETMIRDGETHMLMGGLIGSLSGAILGGYLGNQSADQSAGGWARLDRELSTGAWASVGFFAGLAGGVVLGAVCCGDEEIPLARLDSSARMERLESIVWDR